MAQDNSFSDAQVYDIPHPAGAGNKDIELAIFKDHRFAFYYWLKWSRRAGGEPPALVTVDWHRDLAPPPSGKRSALKRVAASGLNQVMEFVRTQMDPHNDEQVLSAAWLNLVGDIYLLKNYGMQQEESFAGRNGEPHRIREFEDKDRFTAAVTGAGASRIYLDIDLDYFVKNKVAPHQRDEVELYDDEEIRKFIDPGGQLFGQLFERLAGFTIATEPRYCGGTGNSVHLLEVVLSRLFTPDMEWRHQA